MVDADYYLYGGRAMDAKSWVGDDTREAHEEIPTCWTCGEDARDGEQRNGAVFCRPCLKQMQAQGEREYLERQTGER